jgi:hypothetical protein
VVFSISNHMLCLNISRCYSVLSGCSKRSNSGNVALKCSLLSLSINTRLHFVGERRRMHSRYDPANVGRLDKKKKSTIKTGNSAGKKSVQFLA